MIHVPKDMHEAMERHDVALVTDVRYRVVDNALRASVTAVASHESSLERRRVLGECGWLADPQEPA